MNSQSEVVAHHISAGGDRPSEGRPAEAGQSSWEMRGIQTGVRVLADSLGLSSCRGGGGGRTLFVKGEGYESTNFILICSPFLIAGAVLYTL